MDESSEKNKDSNSEWEKYLNGIFVENDLFDDVSIFHLERGIVGYTNKEYLLKDLKELDKIKVKFINNGICNSECNCVTKGIEIGNTQFKLLPYFDENLKFLFYSGCGKRMLIFQNKNLFLFGFKKVNEKDTKDLHKFFNLDIIAKYAQSIFIQLKN